MQSVRAALEYTTYVQGKAKRERDMLEQLPDARGQNGTLKITTNEQGCVFVMVNINSNVSLLRASMFGFLSRFIILLLAASGRDLSRTLSEGNSNAAA